MLIGKKKEKNSVIKYLTDCLIINVFSKEYFSWQNQMQRYFQKLRSIKLASSPKSIPTMYLQGLVHLMDSPQHSLEDSCRFCRQYSQAILQAYSDDSMKRANPKEKLDLQG